MNNKGEIMSRIEDAIKYKEDGLNCTESVLKAYHDLCDVSFETLRRIGSGFGLGMGCFEATCGSLVGANMILGLLNNNPRKRTMTLSARMLEKFKEKTTSSTCKILKGIETGVVLCSCSDCVKYACEALEEVLVEAKIEINSK